MANEAVCIETPTIFQRRTIAAGAVIPFGTIMKLEDDDTVVISASDNDAFGGIAWTPSISTDTFTFITVAMDGIWDIKDTGGGSAGAIVNVAGANIVSDSATADLITGSVVGKRMMDASSGEVTRIRVGHNT